jgi:hypothetical protein
MMKQNLFTLAFSFCSLLCVAVDRPAAGQSTPEGDESVAEKASASVTVSEARRQAELLHATVHATLQAVHHELHRPDEGLRLPADVLKDVFAEVEESQKVSLRWLAVEGQAMNTDHIARTDFEREAAKNLKAGHRNYEQVDAGVLRRAAPIILGNQCLKCHVPDRKSLENRIAGLIITIPVKQD